MAEGAPDYTKLVQILGRDADGNLVTVRVDPSGRIILLPYGVMEVEGGVNVTQEDLNRIVSGEFEGGPIPLLVDALGRLIMIPYGYDGTNYHLLKVDAAGRIMMVPYGTTTVEGEMDVNQTTFERTMQGLDGEELHSIMVDGLGRMVMVPYGFDGIDYRILKVDQEGRMVAIMKGAADFTLDCKVWYKFLVKEKTVIHDYSGNGNVGTPYSGAGEAAVYAGGVIGQAIVLDGTDDYVLVTDDSDLENLIAFTLEVWVNIVSGGVSGSRIFDKNNEKQVFEEADAHYSARVKCATTNAFIRVVNIATPGTWQHIVVTYDDNGTRIPKLYLNGELQTGTETAGEGGINDDTGTAWRIGGREASHFLKGAIDEPRIYTRVLTPEQIKWRYDRTNPEGGKPTRMVAVNDEGHMLVNIEDLPYKRQVLHRQQQVCIVGGNYNLQSSVVPQGKVRVINVCNAYVDTAKIDTIDIGIYDGVDNFIVAYEYGTGLVGWVNIKAPLILKAGDRINAGYVAVAPNGVINLVVNGYELDAP